MARLHSKKKGRSGTKRPKSNDSPEWVELSKEEVESIVRELAQKGVPPSQIGLILRDLHAVPNARAILGMSILAFLRKEKIAPQIPEDLLNLIKRAVRMTNHLKKSKKDVHNKVKLTHVESKIHRLVRYYRKEGVLPSGWKYERDKAHLLVK